jgi:hypothetical protein
MTPAPPNAYGLIQRWPLMSTREIHDHEDSKRVAVLEDVRNRCRSEPAMPSRRHQAPFLLTPAATTEIRSHEDRWRVCIAAVSSGVVAGRMRRGDCNAHTDAWSLFQTAEQFDTCMAHDPLRFADPLMYLQVNKEFQHAFDQRDQSDAHSISRLDPGPGDERTVGH